MTRQAFRIATSGRPGPVALLCPDDILTAESEEKVYADPGCDRYPSMRIRASRESLVAAAELLAGATRPVLIAGGGSVISQAGKEVVRLAEKYGLPVATTLAGKGVIPESHPLSLGAMGGYTGGKYGRGKIANEFVADADIVFLLGSRTDQTPYFNWTLPKEGTKIIHLDIDPLEIGRNFKTDIAMVGDVRETLIDFIDYCAEKNIEMKIETNVEQIERAKDEWNKINQPFLVSEEGPVRPERLIRELADHIDPDTLVVTDASYASLWVMSHMDNMTTGTNFISPRAMAGIGWGLPAAIGAKMGYSGKKVFCLTGDGAFGYVMNELETAARYETKVITIVLNNRMYGFQKHYEELELGKSVECDLLDVDYSEVARALRCQGERVTDPKEINGALERAMNASAPYVLDVVIDANAIPPIAMFDSLNVGPAWGAGPVEGEH
jgi:acetolactate synthase-1/2/3 large subunit